jgi:hypothetical protein
MLQIGSVPLGRLTVIELRLCIDSDASMNVTSRKNITSIIGMISIRPRREPRPLRSFIACSSLPAG